MKLRPEKKSREAVLRIELDIYELDKDKKYICDTLHIVEQMLRTCGLNLQKDTMIENGGTLSILECEVKT